MKKWVHISLMILLILCTGCQGRSSKSINETIEPISTLVETRKQEPISKLNEEDFRKFFEAYFSFTEEELLILNQKRQVADEIYWNNLRKYYRPLITEKLGVYLAQEVMSKLETQYIQGEMDLPKWLLLNNYMVGGTAKVEHIQINSIRKLKDDVIYEISVITTNKCYPIDEFEAQYGWDENAGYFVEKGENASLEIVHLYGIKLEDLKEQRFLFSNQADEMKLQQNFWVRVYEGDSLKVRELHNASPWRVDASNKQKGLDSQYVTRVAFEEEPTEEEQTFLTHLFTTLMQAPRGSYHYYEMAYETGEDLFRKMWEELGFTDCFEINEDYQMAFPVTISPYKDEVDSLGVNKEEIDIQPSIYSTKRQPRFIVTIPVEALLHNHQIVYYNYKYYVGMEENKVEFIRFMNRQAMSKKSDVTFDK